MRSIKSAIFVSCCLALFQFSYARKPELLVGEIDLSSLQWGKQRAVFEVTNNTDYIKYLAIETEVQFTGSHLTPKRRTLTFRLLKPRQSRILTSDVYIPGNYGKAKVTIALYDVVDTLDILLPEYKFFEQPFTATYDIPDKLQPYFGEKFSQLPRVAPLVERHPDFDNEFARLLLILLDEGETVKEIVDLTQADTSFVREIIRNMVDRKYLKKHEATYLVTLPIQVWDTQQPELIVGEINFSSLRWGKQTATFELTNNTNVLKYITVETVVQFTESYLHPNRRSRLHYVLKPLETRIFTPAVYIPGNYGRAHIKISLYDVVDTLDILLPGQNFFTQPFTITFHVPDEIQPYLNERVSLPPMVGHHPDFDNEFARALPFLLNEGKTVGEIASMAMTDTSFVEDVVQKFVDKAYVKRKDGLYQVEFPLITVSEAEETKKLALTFSDSLAIVIASNMSRYGGILDSLVSAGAVDKDSNAFFDGGAVLYRPYPVVAALLLWFDMGQKFIIPSASLAVYDGTDPCHAYIPQYMYAVQGGETFNGAQFYALSLGSPYYRILYGDAVPVIECPEDYSRKAKLKEGIDWRYADLFLPESFMLDTMVVRPVLNSLAKGTDPLLENALSRLRDIAGKYGHEKLLTGQRYWFWNLVATWSLKKLVARAAVARRGNGQFKFDGLQY